MYQAPGSACQTFASSASSGSYIFRLLRLCEVSIANKLGLYRQCVGARKDGGTRQSTCADALPIQPVVLSRGTPTALMGIEYSSAFSRSLRMVVWPRCSLPSAVVGG